MSFFLYILIFQKMYVYFQSHQSNLPLSSKIEQLRAWLTTTNQFFESINLKKEQRRLSYVDYQQFKKELEAQETLYTHLKSQVCFTFHTVPKIRKKCNFSKSFSFGYLFPFFWFQHEDMGPLWKDIDTNWQRVETQLRHLQWILDTALPGELGIIGEKILSDGSSTRNMVSVFGS